MTSPWRKILVFGKKGQLATAFRAVLPQGTLFLGQNEADFCDSKQVLQALVDVKPDLVINTAAYTQVDLAQTHVDACSKINATTVGLIANWCATHNSFLVHFSTDYVFDGRKETPYCENDETNPLNIYGSSKLLGEHLIQKSDAKYWILRTSWLFHESGQNFIKTMLQYAREKDELRVVDDQISSPTYAGHLAPAVARLLDKKNLKPGLYHIANQGYCSRLELMETVIKKAFPFDPQLKARLISAKTKDFPAPAQRPLLTRLDTSKAANELSLTLPAWQDGVEESLRHLYKK